MTGRLFGGIAVDACPRSLEVRGDGTPGSLYTIATASSRRSTGFDYVSVVPFNEELGRQIVRKQCHEKICGKDGLVCAQL